MKLVLAALMALSVSSVSATANAFQCANEAEAQIIAKVVAKKTDSLTYCKATLGEVKFYADNQLCPLFLDEVLNEGVEYTLENGHDCNVQVGTEVSGVLVKNAGRISFE